MTGEVPLSQKVNHQIGDGDTSNVSGKHEGFFAKVKYQKDRDSHDHKLNQGFVEYRHVLVDYEEGTEESQGIKTSNSVDSVHEIDGIDNPQRDKIEDGQGPIGLLLKQAQIIKCHGKGHELNTESEFAGKGVKVIQ